MADTVRTNGRIAKRPTVLIGNLALMWHYTMSYKVCSTNDAVLDNFPSLLIVVIELGVNQCAQNIFARC